ncbi:50S ribosomal protein L22 [Candidatus Gottesmanbacteria bacterium]|nr:50S ribosomal protein L22 [Candidatus Gottesmanbacteria bacterium]
MEVFAYIKYLRISPKKIKKLAQLTVGLSPQTAIDRLFFSGTKAAVLLQKAIRSAQANAVKNHKLEKSVLRIKTIEILKGPIAKRWQPVSRGMAHQIKKRNTHIRVALTDAADLVAGEKEKQSQKSVISQKAENKDLKELKNKKKE